MANRRRHRAIVKICHCWHPRARQILQTFQNFHLLIRVFLVALVSHPSWCAYRLPADAPLESMKFGELVRLLEQNGFRIVREHGSIRYYGKPGVDRLIRVDYHGAKEVPTGTCRAILKAAGLSNEETS